VMIRDSGQINGLSVEKRLGVRHEHSTPRLAGLEG